MTYDFKDQQIEYIREPVNAIKIKNFFDKRTNYASLKEVIGLRNLFGEGGVGDHTGKDTLDKSVRNNDTLYLSSVYRDLKKSILGTALIEAIQSSFLHQITASSFYPLWDMQYTNLSDIQVSKYGGKEAQRYDWHIDAMQARGQRWVSLVYWFFKEPKRFQGGELQLTDGLICGGKLIPQKPKPKIMSIPVENNMALIFGSWTPHAVKPTLLKNGKWEDSRFSVNMWIGFR